MVDEASSSGAVAGVSPIKKHQKAKACVILFLIIYTIVSTKMRAFRLLILSV